MVTYIKHGDEILTYGYVKPRVRWFPNEEDPRPTPSGSLGSYTPWVCSRAPSREETLSSLTTRRPLLGARGLARDLRLPIHANTLARPLAPAQPTSPAKAQVQENVTSYRGSGAPRRCPLGTALPATFLTRSRTGRDTRRQSFPMASTGLEAPGPTRQPLKPTSFTSKKTPEGPPR
jgi:hypothetical protein